MNNIAKAGKSGGDRLHALVLWVSLIPFCAHADLQQQVTTAVESFVSASLPAIDDGGDRELKLSASTDRLPYDSCASELVVSLPGTATLSRNTTVKVACGEDWTLYLPLQIRERHPVVVAATPLSAGTVITDSMLKIELMENLVTPGSSFTTAEPLVGAKVKRYVQAGRPIRSNNLCAVCNGDEVQVLARIGTMVIKTKATAQDDAAIGEPVRVRNSSSGKVFHARVEKVGLVVVNL